MAYNKIIYNDQTLIDLTADTVTPEVLKMGYTAHGADGLPIVGTCKVAEEYNWQPHDGMPDLTSVDLSNYEDCVLLTYDASLADKWLGFYVKGAKSVNILVEVGTIQNGEFIVESSITNWKTNATNRNLFPETAYRWPVVRVTCPTQAMTYVQVTTAPAALYDPKTTSLPAICNAIVDCRLKGKNINNLTSNVFTQRMEHIQLENITEVTSYSQVFYQKFNIQQIDFVNCNTAKATTFYRLFHACYNLQKITGYENFNTSAVTTFENCFYQCTKLQTININKWSMASAITLKNCFYGCYSLVNLFIDELDTSHITTFEGLFQGCQALVSLDLSKWTTSACTNFSKIFSGAYLLQHLNLSGWDVHASTTFSQLFYQLYTLEELDLSSWTLPDLSASSMITNLFVGLYNIDSLKIPDGLTFAFTVNFNELSVDDLEYLSYHIGEANGGKQTLTLGNLKYKIDNEAKARITNKGWTIA